jgi:hypothetical protein
MPYKTVPPIENISASYKINYQLGQKWYFYNGIKNKELPYILAYKARNVGQKLELLFVIQLICGSTKTWI